MDAFARFFPPQVRLTAGIELPQTLLLAELSSVAKFGWSLASGRYLRYRNHPHQRVLDMFVEWLTQGTPYPLTMTAALPTIRLLNEIEKWIPQYSSEGSQGVEASEAQPLKTVSAPPIAGSA
jgi:hypothetical protein